MVEPAAWSWYDVHAARAAEQYEGLDPAQVHAWLIPWLPPAPARVLDGWAGSGRRCSLGRGKWIPV